MKRPQLKLWMSTKISATLKDADKLRQNAAKQADGRSVAVRHPIAFHRRRWLELGDRRASLCMAVGNEERLFQIAWANRSDRMYCFPTIYCTCLPARRSDRSPYSVGCAPTIR